MLALILHLVAMPMPMGSRLRWLMLAGMIMRPRGDFVADQFGRNLFALGDKAHFFGNDAFARKVHLRHVAVAVGAGLLRFALFNPLIPKRHKAPSMPDTARRRNTRRR